MALERRWPRLRRDQLDEDQVRMFDAVASSRRHLPSVDADGYLLGPFDALLRAPDIGTSVSAMSDHIRVMQIEGWVREVVILTVGAHSRSEFQWWAHIPLARDHGTSEEGLAALARHETPKFERDDEQLAYELTRQLLTTGHLDDSTFAAAEQMFGQRGLTEVVALVGYYCLVCYAINAFRIPIPEGEPLTWGD